MHVEVKLVHPTTVVGDRASAQDASGMIDVDAARTIYIQPNHAWNFYENLLEVQLMDGDECIGHVCLSINKKGKFSLSKRNPKTGASDS